MHDVIDSDESEKEHKIFKKSSYQILVGAIKESSEDTRQEIVKSLQEQLEEIVAQ